MRRDHAPLSVGQIGLVSRDGAAMLLLSGWRPHDESKVGWRNPLEITAAAIVTKNFPLLASVGML